MFDLVDTGSPCLRRKFAAPDNDRVSSIRDGENIRSAAVPGTRTDLLAIPISQLWFVKHAPCPSPHSCNTRSGRQSSYLLRRTIG
nr:hypothetical protein CFP56_11145 [Quercus suber]